jgi:hypothetical protein
MSDGSGTYCDSGIDGTHLTGVSVAAKNGVDAPGCETRTSVPPFGTSVKEKSARYLGTGCEVRRWRIKCSEPRRTAPVSPVFTG